MLFILWWWTQTICFSVRVWVAHRNVSRILCKVMSEVVTRTHLLKYVYCSTFYLYYGMKTMFLSQRGPTKCICYIFCVKSSHDQKWRGWQQLKMMTICLFAICYLFKYLMARVVKRPTWQLPEQSPAPSPGFQSEDKFQMMDSDWFIRIKMDINMFRWIWTDSPRAHAKSSCGGDTRQDGDTTRSL